MNCKKKLFLLLFLLLTFPAIRAQIDSLIVEKYYISDGKDATNVTGGTLPINAITYRIYVDLAAGSKLLKIYGDENHQFRILSTSVFFNNKSRGRSFGKEIRVSTLDENTIALDTWLTIGLASENHYGLFKEEDSNGSIIGGLNNDGGSALIAGGLLTNSDPEAGIPLIMADGLTQATILPQNWIYRLNGKDFTTSTDTSIFGNLKAGNSFISNSFSISNKGVSDITSNNRVLIAQLTTLGELTFSINVEIQENTPSGPVNVKYVAMDPAGDENTNRFLTYPPLPPPPPKCGCKDPNYIEFDKSLECHVQDSCKTTIVFGCADPKACNYDPSATFNISSMCCYPGRCNNRDIRVVCPDIQGQDDNLSFSIYPNPGKDNITLEISEAAGSDVQCLLYDANGTIHLTEKLGTIPNRLLHQINVSGLSKGLYFFRLSDEDHSVTKTFIKN